MDNKDKTPLEKKRDKDQRILKALKVSEISYHIGRTNKGPLDLMVRYGEDTYQFLLDSAPLDKEDNDKMLSLFNLK